LPGIDKAARNLATNPEAKVTFNLRGNHASQAAAR